MIRFVTIAALALVLAVVVGCGAATFRTCPKTNARESENVSADSITLDSVG